MNVRLVVVKIGGSLFNQPNFVPRLKVRIEQLEEEFSPAHLVLIAGGGPLVEALRQIDHPDRLDEVAAHWTAIHFMDVNALLLKDMWPELKYANSLAELREACKETGKSLFGVEAFMKNHEPNLPGLKLAVGWDVTSDSIAARVARVLGPTPLVLLKSVFLRPDGDLQKMASAGQIDIFFPKIFRELTEVHFRTI